jgi:uncharacterized protein YgiB involved in biofilm formation
MGKIVLPVIAAGAAIMAWLWFQPVCRAGQVVADEQACAARFDAAFCQRAFARAQAIAQTAGPSYLTDAECRANWPFCIERIPQGFGPRPSGWCVVRASDGALARFEPQYDNYRR